MPVTPKIFPKFCRNFARKITSFAIICIISSLCYWLISLLQKKSNFLLDSCGGIAYISGDKGANTARKESQVDTNGLFGRLVKVDRRDKRFPITAVLPRGAKRRSYTWACSVQLNQGHVGACTGFSVAAEAAARPAIVGGITNKVALEVYYRAQELDDIPGEDYEGSTVRGAMKAATERGWYREYRWAANEEELAMAIGYHGPAVLGIDWYEGMMTPDSSGLVAVTGDVQGGHAILCVGYNAKRGLYRLHNSWGRQWGKDGDCFVTQADMKRLLRGFGEACIPVKRLVPRMGK